MKIEKVKARTLYMFEGQEFGTLREAQRAALVSWLRLTGSGSFVEVATAEAIADAIIEAPGTFRALVAPFMYKPRGRKPKAVQLETGEDGEPQAVAEAA